MGDSFFLDMGHMLTIKAILVISTVDCQGNHGESAFKDLFKEKI